MMWNKQLSSVFVLITVCMSGLMQSAAVDESAGTHLHQIRCAALLQQYESIADDNLLERIAQQDICTTRVELHALHEDIHKRLTTFVHFAAYNIDELPLACNALRNNKVRLAQDLSVPLRRLKGAFDAQCSKASPRKSCLADRDLAPFLTLFSNNVATHLLYLCFDERVRSGDALLPLQEALFECGASRDRIQCTNEDINRANVCKDGAKTYFETFCKEKHGITTYQCDPEPIFIEVMQAHAPQSFALFLARGEKERINKPVYLLHPALSILIQMRKPAPSRDVAFNSMMHALLDAGAVVNIPIRKTDDLNGILHDYVKWGITPRRQNAIDEEVVKKILAKNPDEEQLIETQSLFIAYEQSPRGVLPSNFHQVKQLVDNHLVKILEPLSPLKISPRTEAPVILTALEGGFEDVSIDTPKPSATSTGLTQKKNVSHCCVIL